MIYEVTPDLKHIDFGATGVKEILQNVAMIMSSVVFSCPLDRSFAINYGVDGPINHVMASISADIVTKVQQYEPRAEVTEIIFDGDGNSGRLIPKVRLAINSDA